MKPFSLPTQEHGFALGMSLLVAGAVGSLLAASDDLARDSIGIVLVCFALLGMVAHVLFTQPERGNASWIGALLAVLSLPIGLGLILYSGAAPGTSSGLLGIDTSVIEPIRDASSLALLASGVVSGVMYGLSVWLAPRWRTLAASPRWLFVAPLYLFAGVAVRFEVPLDRWQYFLFALGAGFLCGYLGLLFHRIHQIKRAGENLLLAAGIFLLASVAFMPFREASTTLGEVLYLLALVGTFCVITSWYTSLGYMALLASSIVLLAGELGSDTEWYAGALMAICGLVLIGGLLILRAEPAPEEQAVASDTETAETAPD